MQLFFNILNFTSKKNEKIHLEQRKNIEGAI